ncbi:biotin/lipoyl-binding protein [Sulfurimonas sp. MAG313]|nr:biotin/lipoyl-binding protein [Sulfurimonas sp. MAG313]MDF1880353.1 biotin/lipoyl-binding protein [Sulfurimonas sp. MAG313]
MNILIVIILFLFLPWQQTVKGVGSVVALDPTQRPYAILATIDGLIHEYHVKEGQFVHKGDLLFTMVDLDRGYHKKLNKIQENLSNRQENLEKQILISNDRVDNTQDYLELGLHVYAQKFTQIENKIKSLRLKEISLRKKYEIEKLNFQRISLLYKDGIESKRKYDSSENMYIRSKAELEKIAIDIEIEKNNTQILNKEKEKFLKETQNKVKSLENTVLSSQNQVTLINENAQSHAVVVSRYAQSQVYAQKDGHVVRLLQNDKNKLIKKGDKIIYFAPKVTQKAILMKLSDFNMPLIKKDLHARIVFYGWPSMQISGWPMIKHGTFSGVIKQVDPISYDQGYYYAYVVEDFEEPWPHGDVLKIGTQASLWVRLNTVSIWYQLWRTVNGLPPRMITTKISEK